MIIYDQKILPPISENSLTAIDAFMNYSHEMVISGPRNCSKTMLISMLILSLHEMVAGFRSLIVRSEMRTISTTVIPTFERLLHYPLEHPNQPFILNGGLNLPRSIRFKNEGVMLFGGLDNASKVLGGEYDLIWVNQAERVTDTSVWSSLHGCVDGGRGDNWYDRNDKKRWLMVSDCNPGSPYHHLYQRKDELDWFDFTHKDSPLFYDKDGWTETGRTTYNALLKSHPEGYLRDRMVHGLWKAAEGQVYPQWKEHHVKKIKISDFDRSTKWRLSVDWGYTNPAAIGLFAEHKGLHYLFKEIYITQTTVEDLAKMCNELLSNLDIKIVETITDHNPEHEEQFRKAGLKPKQADKSVAEGIEAVRQALDNDKIFVNIDSLDKRDPNLLDKPQGLKEEIVSYAYKPPEDLKGSDKDEEPVKENDHACDMFRYYLKHIEQKRNFIPAPYILEEKPAKRRGVWM